MSAAPTTSSDRDAPDLVGRAFGRFVLLRRLASGGMATVYLAENRAERGFRKLVAIKTIHPHLAGDPAFVELFHDEARLAARIDHPNVCTVFDFGKLEGTYFLAMEYLRGVTATAVIRRAASHPAAAIDLAISVITDAARGLHAAHELRNERGESERVVHRDISPQNVMVLFTGQAKIVDFGVARFDGRVQHTATGELRGKPGYLAPERLRGDAIDRRADVFSLGVVLWEMITRKRLFHADDAAATMHAVLHREIPVPSSVAPDCPPELDVIALRALARDPADRFASCDAMARALEDLAHARAQPTGARGVATWMQSAFADEIRAEEDSLASLSRASVVPPANLATTVAAPTPTRSEPIARRPRWQIAIAASVAVTVAVLATLALRNTAPSANVATAPRVNPQPVPAAPAAAATSTSTSAPTAPEPRPAVATPTVEPPTRSTRPTRREPAHHGPPLRPMRGYPEGS